MYSAKLVIVAITLLFASALGNDPASSWVTYAAGTAPGKRITYLKAEWIVPAGPYPAGQAPMATAPWVGIAPADGLNLIQPVSVYSIDHWETYNEYFQWEPISNTNFPGKGYANVGDHLVAEIVYDPNTLSYDMYYKNLNTSWSVGNNVKVQIPVGQTVPKNYTVVYLVFENAVSSSCSQWPASNGITFFNIQAQYDNVSVTLNWKTGSVQNRCSPTQQVIDSNTVHLGWNSTAAWPTRAPGTTGGRPTRPPSDYEDQYGYYWYQQALLDEWGVSEY